MAPHRLAWDQGFVAAPRERAFGAVAEPAGYAGWWPGAAVSPSDGVVTVRLPGVPPLVLSREDARPGVGAVFGVDGRMRGRWEWYLEPFEEGTILNSVIELDIPGGDRLGDRRLYRVRAAVRRGLVALKGALE